MGTFFLFPLLFAFLLFSAVCKAYSDNHFAFLHFLFLGMVWITASCTISQTSIHSSSGILSDLTPWIYFSLHCIIVRDLIWLILERSSGFSCFLQFKSEFHSKEFMISATVSSWTCFCWLYRASPSLAAKNIIILIFGVDHLVLSTCRVFSCVVGRGCLLWPVCSLGKTLLAFAQLHSQAKFGCYSRYFLTSCFCIPVPYNEKDIFFGC